MRHCCPKRPVTLISRDIPLPEASEGDRPRPAGRQGAFAWRDGRIEIRKTGVCLKIDMDLVREIGAWGIYLAVLGVAIMLARVKRRDRLAVWYTPERPGPWYLLHGAALWAGWRSARSAAEADAAFYFDDTTQGAGPPPCGIPIFNSRCTDISKTHVAEVFAEVFGYPLRLDPERSVGEIVEKADKNGVHDGAVVSAPLRPRDGYVYQRLVDTRDENGLVHDLRTPCVGGVPVVVWEKTKPADRRFAIHNRRAVLREPATLFSETELDRISAFAGRMGLDWGGLDILRDGNDGRLYIVDVNKTDLGPVIALSWADKIRSMNRLSRALSALVRPALAKADSLASPNAQGAHPGLKALTAPLVLVGASLALTLFWLMVHPQTGAIAALGRHAEALRGLASLHPVAAPLLFALAYAAAVVVTLPVALIMTFAGGYILGAAGGALSSIAGATLGAVVVYGLAILSPGGAVGWLKTRVPRIERLRASFAGKPFRFTLSLRLMPLTPFTLVSLAAGLARIGWAPFTIGTMLGVMPECIAYAAIGGGLSHTSMHDPATLFAQFRHPTLWIGLGALAALAFLTLRSGRADDTRQGLLQPKAGKKVVERPPEAEAVG